MKTSTFLTPLLLSAALLWSGCEQEPLSIHDSGNLVPKTVDEDPSLPSIFVNGAQLHAEAFGNPNDPLLVVLHGGPGADYRYMLRCKEFASEGFRVIFYDQRGAGLSQRFPYDTYTIQVAYDDLKAVIAHYRTSPTQKVFLLGQSWGAMLASIYINQYPNDIDGAILGEPGGLIWQDVIDYISRSRKMSFFSEDVNDAVFADQFMTGRKNDHAILDYKYELWAAAEDAADNPLGNEGRLPYWRSGAVTNKAYIDLGLEQEPNWTLNLHQYTTNVLFIYSERNRAYGLAHAQKVSSAFPNVDLFEAKGTGHDMFSFETGWNNTFPVMLDYLNVLK